MKDDNGHMLKPTTGNDIVGRLRWSRMQTDDDGNVHWLLCLEDSYGSMHVWCSPQTTVEPLQIWSVYRAVGQWCERRQDNLFAAVSMQRINNPDNTGELLPHLDCPLPDRLIDFIWYVEAIQNPNVYRFVNALFNRQDIARPFLEVPASRQHHHAYPGGLLDHSLECVQLAGSMCTGMSSSERDLIQLAALLHDIGKLRVLKPDGGRTAMGLAVDHDTLTLEILAPQLRQLDTDWPTGGMALRVLLQHRGRRQAAPNYPGCEIVRAADRISATQAAAAQAFNGTPAWRNLSESLGDSRYWRLSG